MDIIDQLKAARRCLERPELKVSELLGVASELMETRNAKDVDIAMNYEDRAELMTAAGMKYGEPESYNAAGFNWHSLKVEAGEIHLVWVFDLDEPGRIFMIDWSEVYPDSSGGVKLGSPDRSAAFIGVKRFIAG